MLGGGQHDLVDVAVEGVIGEPGQRVDAIEIIVRLVRQRLAPPVGVSVLVSQDARAAGVDPVAGLFFAVPCCEAGRKCFCSSCVV